MNRIPFSLLIRTSILAFYLTACIEDRTIDDWRREKVGEEVARIEAISGTYVGTLKSNQSNRVIGQVELVLEADTRVSARGDRPGAEKQAVLRGRFTVSSDQFRMIHFEGGSYDSEDGSFKAEANVTDVVGNLVSISFAGKVDNNVITGRVEALHQSEGAGNFELKLTDRENSDRDVNIPPSQLNPDNPQATPDSKVLSYRGSATWKDPNERRTVEVLILKHSLSSDQEFLNLFSPVQWVDVTLNLDFGSPQRPKVTSVYFQNAQWDTRLGTLRGSLSGGSVGNGDRYKINLNCEVTASALVCEYFSAAQGKLFTITGEASTPSTPGVLN